MSCIHLEQSFHKIKQSGSHKVCFHCAAFETEKEVSSLLRFGIKLKLKVFADARQKQKKVRKKKISCSI